MFETIVFVALIFIIFGIALTVYRLYFHPLSSYPGPKLTAATHWVEFYHDIYRQGQFTFKIKEWHAKYGPIIRVNPDELHVDDPSFCETLYSGPGAKREKYEAACRMAGSLGSAFATPGHDLHRSRRKAYQNFFSKAAITKIEPLILQNVKKVEQKVEQAMRNNEVLAIGLVYFAFSMDVITRYAFDDPDSMLDDEAMALDWKQTLSIGASTGALSRQFPWIFPIVNQIPLPLTRFLSQPLHRMLYWRHRGRQRVEPILNYETNVDKDGGRQTVFHDIRDSDLPASEKGVERLVDEAQVFISAGGETTSHMLSVTTYYLLTNEESLKRLQCELIAAGGGHSDLSWTTLEQLPYLSAVISEGLRFSYGVTTRLQRIAVGEQLYYDGQPIPPGTPVGMTQYFSMQNPTIFPEPLTFRPERWLHDDGSYDVSMNKHIYNFGKGSRNCVGMNLAYAEIYMVLARIFGRYELELYGTDASDVSFVRDIFVAAPKLGTKGVRVHVKKLLASK